MEGVMAQHKTFHTPPLGDVGSSFHREFGIWKEHVHRLCQKMTRVRDLEICTVQKKGSMYVSEVKV